MMSDMEQVMKLVDERILTQMMPDPQHRDTFIRMLIFYILSV